VSQLSAEDRLAIAEVVGAYCHAIDLGRWDELCTMFTADGRLDMGQVMGVYEGHAGLRKFGDTLKATGIFMRHYTTNLVIRGDGERARAECYVLAATGQPGDLHQTTGRYEDDFVKQNGRWLLRSRRVLLDVPSPQ